MVSLISPHLYQSSWINVHLVLWRLIGVKSLMGMWPGLQICSTRSQRGGTSHSASSKQPGLGGDLPSRPDNSFLHIYFRRLVILWFLHSCTKDISFRLEHEQRLWKLWNLWIYIVVKRSQLWHYFALWHYDIKSSLHFAYWSKLIPCFKTTLSQKRSPLG